MAALIADDAIGGNSGFAIIGSASLAAEGRVVVDMIILLCTDDDDVPDGISHRCVGVAATADAPDGHRPQVTLGRLEMMQQSQRMIRAICLGIFPGEHACLFGGLLACLFQRLWYAVSMGRQHRRVVDPRS